MRTLKKTLALVLVVAMVLSFGVIGASADFTDVKADNEYKTAIDVLSGIGVINGMTSTTFEPDGSLTRAQAAKIIAYMLLGTTNAELISSATSQKFSDVPTSHWAAGYIEYCANIGVINGVGDGKFAPEGKLTTAAFTKMLLVALGYKADVEGFTGEGWAINVASKAVETGVYDSSITISDAVNATRGQAAQLAFKTLTADLVEYKGGSTVTVNGVEIVTGANLEKVANTSRDYRSDYSYTAGSSAAKNDTVMQFCEKYFPRLTAQSVTLNGQTGYRWEYNSKTIATFVTNDSVLATSADGTAMVKLTNASDSKYIGFRPEAAPATVSYYYNDKQISATTGSSAGDIYVSNDVLYRHNGTVGVDIADIAGVVVQFIDTDNNGRYNIVSVVEKSVGKVTANVTTRTSGAVTNVTIPNNAGVTINSVNSTGVTYPADLSKDDIILVYTGAQGHIYVEKAASVSGTITSYVSGRSVTIDGVSYAASGLGKSPVTQAQLQGYVNKEGYTFYLDNGKNICYVNAPDSTVTLRSNTVFVSSVAFASGLGGGTYSARLVNADGTTQDVTVSKVANFGGTLKKVDKSNASGATAGTVGDAGVLNSGYFYTYTVNSDGSYNLTYAAEIAGTLGTATTGADQNAYTSNNSVAIKAKTAQFLRDGSDNAIGYTLGTNNTVFVYHNTSNNTYVTRTGIGNALNVAKAAGVQVYVLKDTNNYALFVYVESSGTSVSADSRDYYFLSDGSVSVRQENNTTVYTYNVYKNGELTTVDSYDTTMLTPGVLYTATSYATNGYVQSFAAVSGTTLKATSGTEGAEVYPISYAGGTLSVTDSSSNTIFYTVNSDVRVFVYDNTYDNPSTQETSVDNLQQGYVYANDNDVIYLVRTSDSNASIAYIYVYINATT